MRDDGYRPSFAEPENYSYVGPFIACVRTKLGLTQAQLSDKVGFSIQSISRFENGKVSPTTIMATHVVDYILKTADLDTAYVIDWFNQFVMTEKEQSE